MKKRLISLSVMTIIAWTTMMAVTINDIRVYVNPGHGCWITRNLPLVNKALKDTTGFHESNTNLWKAFGLMEKLIEWGVPFDRSLNQINDHHRVGAAKSFKNNIVFSRVKNTPWYGDDTSELYNRDLTEVAYEANANDFDYFISIHSNAFEDGTNTNYMSLFYNANVSSSYNSTMVAGWYLLENPHQMWTNYTSSPYLLNGLTANGGYEVLMTLYVPGYMSETFFHTYQPARHKIMNPQVARIEGIGYAKGINDYFSLGKKDSYGMIYGVLRHATETFTHTYYNPNTSTLDKYKPINGATVKLKKDGQVLQTVTTDNFYNGTFVFDKVAPGSYIIECSHDDYATSTMTVSVEANKISYPTASISSEGITQAAIQGAYAYAHSMTKNGNDYKFSFKSTASAPKANIVLTNKSTGASTSYNMGAVKKGDNSYTISTSNIGEGEYTWAVSITNERSTFAQAYYNQGGTTENNRRGGVAIDLDTESKYFGHIYSSVGYAGGIQRYNPDLTKNGGIILADKFDSETSSSPYRIKANSGKLYISDWSDGTNSGIYVYNPDNGSLNQIFQGSRDSKGQWTNNGVVVGGSSTCVDFWGTGSDRYMYTYCEDYSTGKRLVRYKLGTADTWGQAPSNVFDGISSYMTSSVEVATCDKGVWVCHNYIGTNNTEDKPAFLFMNHSGNLKFSSYSLGGANATTEAPESGIAINKDMTKLAVANDNYGNINIYNVTWNGETPTLAFSYEINVGHSADGSTAAIEQIVFDPADNMLIFSRQQGLMAYTLKNPERNTVTAAPKSQVVSGNGTVVEPEEPETPVEPEPEPETPGVKRGSYAYDFSLSVNAENKYEIKYKITEAVKDADLVFTNIETGKTEVINIGFIDSAIDKGEAHLIMEKNELPEGKYTWGVTLYNAESIASEVIYDQGGTVHDNNTRGGVTIDLDFESPYFGYVYTATGYATGVQLFNPDLTPNGEAILSENFTIGKSSSPYRIKANSGKLYLSDWSDTNAGIYVYNPANGSFSQVFQGTRASSGLWTNNNTNVGGSMTCVDFCGTGNNRKMYSFCEDIKSNDNKFLVRYDLGTADTWGKAPSYIFDGISGYLGNNNVEVATCEKGVWICQNSMGDTNPDENKPAFLFMDHGGNLKFNSHSLGQANYMTAAPEGGIAINKDMTKLAVANDNYGNINIYNVTWNGNTPSLSFSYEINVGHSFGTNHYPAIEQMMFDPADNLLAFSRQKGFMAFTTKNPERKTTTYAPSSQIIETIGNIPTGIENMIQEETAVEYYNLQGVKVENPANGLYIKKQGNKVTKVVL